MLNATSVLGHSGRKSDDAIIDPTDYLVMAYNATSTFDEFQNLINAPTVDALEYVMIRAMSNKQLADKGKTKR